jgi:hypothetical protein
MNADPSGPGDNRPPGHPPPPSGPPPSSPPKSADDLMHLADSLGFQTPARRDPLKAPAMAFVAVEETGGPVPNVPDVRARDEGRAGGAVGAATFTLPPTPPAWRP